ncbi:MAG: S41 family peptidase [Chitinispirillales bacterium]|jgi:hypothetical protein|nr:S41 family peptidase [Chitinispirillales bacterium]
MSDIGKEKKKRRCQRKLLMFAVIAVFALTGGCVHRDSDDFLIPADNGGVDNGERYSVWQSLKIYSIYHDRLPDYIGSMTPNDMFDSIHDTLHGVRYTEYLSDHLGGSEELFDPNTEFYEPMEFTPSTVYFYLPEFSDTALVFFNEVLPRLSEYPNIIIDVRNNGGGYIGVTDAILGELLPYGTPYLNVRYRDYNSRYNAGETFEDVFSTETPSPALLNKKVAVLINGYSASASEILAAGLKDGAGAYLVGSNSYGKGIGQLLIPIETRERIRKLSVTFLEISGISERTGQYHRVGIEPDQVPADIESYVDARIPNARQRGIIQAEVEEIQAEYPNIPASYIRQQLIRELREMYYALKMLQPEFSLTEDDGDDVGEDGGVVDAMGKRRSAGIGEMAARIHGARERAKARWRPMGAVIGDRKGLPNVKLSGD